MHCVVPIIQRLVHNILLICSLVFPGSAAILACCFMAAQSERAGKDACAPRKRQSIRDQSPFQLLLFVPEFIADNDRVLPLEIHGQQLWMKTF